jgi:hypothetical protein
VGKIRNLLAITILALSYDNPILSIQGYR